MQRECFGRLLLAWVVSSAIGLTAYDCDEPTPVKPLRLDTVAPCEVIIPVLCMKKCSG